MIAMPVVHPTEESPPTMLSVRTAIREASVLRALTMDVDEVVVEVIVNSTDTALLVASKSPWIHAHNKGLTFLANLRSRLLTAGAPTKVKLSSTMNKLVRLSQRPISKRL